MTQFGTFACAESERQRAEYRRAGGHHDGTEAHKASLLDRLARIEPSRSAASAKSIIMIAFFLTMPMSSNTPIAAMTVNWVSNSRSASAAPTLAENSVERIVIGWMKLS